MASHSSAQDSLTEHAICMMMDNTHILLSDSGLADKFWAEAASMSIHTQNLALFHHHPGQIPAEKFSSRHQDVSYLHVFGSSKCMFLGYAGANYHVLN